MPCVIPETGTDEELRESVIAYFEPWQPIIGCYYAVKLSGDSPGIRPVWSLLSVKSVVNGVVELDMLFEPFGCYRDMPIYDWLEMWWVGDQIMPIHEAVQRCLITEEAIVKLRANRDPALAKDYQVAKIVEDTGDWHHSSVGLRWASKWHPNIN